jgi:O-antigen ligase
MTLAIAAFLTGFFPPLSIAGANAAWLFFACAALIAHGRGGEKVAPSRTGFEPAIFFFLGAWALSAAAGIDPGKSLSRLAAQLRFVPFLLLAWTGGGRHREQALNGYLAGAAAAVAWGYLQALFTATGLAAAAGGKSAYYLGFASLRAHGGVHPLTYAALILPFFFFGAAYFLEAEGRRALMVRSLWPLTAGGALLLSQSRGPWLAAGAGLAALVAFHRRRARLAAPLLILAGAIFLHPGLRARFASLRGGTPDQSRVHRFILWNNAWETGKRHPFTGVGPGNLAKGVMIHRTEPGYLPNPFGMDGDAHNQYLHHFAERGFLGLAALLVLLATPFCLAATGLKRPADGRGPPAWVKWGLFAFFLSFPLMNVTERVFDDAEPCLVFWVLASLLVSASHARGGGIAARSSDAGRTSG